MWRTPVSVLLSAILGSAVATVVYAFWLSISQSGGVINPSEDMRITFAVFLGALWFTTPGAFLLAAVEFALSDRVRLDRVLDGALMGVGALAGAAILGVLSVQEAALDFALLGGFYGLTTATIFVLIQRHFGSRRKRRL